jgi:hypothetical protein
MAKTQKAVKAEDMRQTIKSDPAAPESPVVPTEDADLTDAPAEPKAVKVKEGDTLAAHESHVLLSSQDAIDERIEREQKENLTTDVIAREQQERAVAHEAQVKADTTPPADLIPLDDRPDSARKRDAADARG